jgi:hypothetical protein
MLERMERRYEYLGIRRSAASAVRVVLEHRQDHWSGGQSPDDP